MTGGQLWIEVRYRLIVLGSAAAVIGSMALALHGSVDVGPAPPEPVDLNSRFSGEILAWKSGQPALVGIARSQADLDCVSLVMWFDIDGRPAFIGIGPLAARHQTQWTGYLEDPRGQRVPAGRAEPQPSFFCYRWADPQPPSP